MNSEAKSMELGADPLDLFLHAFSARDIAEAIPSFDDTTPAATIRAAMDSQSLELVGIRRAGSLMGWLKRDDVFENGVFENGAVDAASLPFRPFDPVSVIPDSASLHLVVQGLDAAPYLFVRTFGSVSGVICRADLLKPAVRMWLFGLVTITELRMTRLIENVLPNEAWQRYLSPSRLQMATELQSQRRLRNEHRTLLDSLQFADKARIVTRHDELRSLTRFSSRRSFEEFARQFQDLRNSLAHSQDILKDWPVIVDLATNLHRFVLGPASPSVEKAEAAVQTSGSNGADPWEQP